MAGVGRGSGARRASRRDAIEAAALGLFAERGVDGTGLRDVAARAGVTVPGIFAHFAGKEALVDELFRSGMAVYARRIRDASDSAEASGGGHRARLAAVVRAVLELFDEDGIRFRFLVLRQHDRLGRVDLGGPDGNPVEAIRALVVGAMEAGEIPARDPDLAALVAVGVVLQPVTGRIYGRLQGALAPRARDVADMCWAALGGR